MSRSISKLGDDKSYKRPKKTLQEKLSADEIDEKLQGYDVVDDIDDVALNTHVRYFIRGEDNVPLFRTGGFLSNKTNCEKYIMLTNGKNIWSVQVKDTIFYKKLSQKEEMEIFKKIYEKKIFEKEQTITALKNFIIKNKLTIPVIKYNKSTNIPDTKQIKTTMFAPTKPIKTTTIFASNTKETQGGSKSNKNNLNSRSKSKSKPKYRSKTK